MTSAYYAGLGKAAVGLPDISKTNYMKTEADMAKSVNQNIDETQRLNDEYFDGLINYYNHELKKKTPGEQAVATLTQFTKMAPQFLEDKKKFDKWLEFRKSYKQFSDLRFSDAAMDKNTGKIREDWFLQDQEVLTWTKVQPEMDANQSESLALAKEYLAKGEMDKARDLFRGLGDSFVDTVDIDRTAGKLLEDYENIYRPKAEAGMKVWVPWLNNGEGGYAVYNDVLNDERTRSYIDQVIDSYYAFRHEDVFRGRRGKFKHEFVAKLLEKEGVRTTAASVAQGKALVDNANKTRAQDITQNIVKDPSYIVRGINKYKGSFAENWDDLSKRSVMQASRADMFNTLETVVRNDPSSIPAVLKALNHPFQAFDGQNTTPKDFWKKESQSLLKVIREVQGENTTALNNEKEAADEAAITKLEEKSNSRTVPWTAKERFNEITSYMRETGITDPQKVPDRIKNIAYQGQELDEDIDFRLRTRLNRGEKLTYADLGAISDPIMLDKWRKAIVDQAGAGLDYDQVTKAKGAINAVILQRLQIKDLNKAAGNPIYEANKENAYDAYLAEWNRVKKAQPGISDRDAHKAAMDVVTTGVNTLVPGSQVDYIWDRRLGIGLNQNLKDDVQNARKQLIEDNSLLTSETPLDGEAPYLEQAVKYINTTNAGLPGQLPTYYRMLAKNMPGKYGNPELLMRSRLEANGLLKGDDISIPEYKNLPESQATNLTVNPTSCKTYVQMQNIAASGEDIGWMLDVIQDPNAVKEGGYDYVVGPNIDQGKDAHLPKPLTEHTVGEVLELVNSGHTDLGIYAITGSGFKAIVEANQVPLDIPFNKQTQDLFVLGRLRQKAQQSQNYTTQQDAYRRLVNIRPEDNEEFLRIVGDLPPFLQLSNMIPICSTELVNQTLQR